MLQSLVIFINNTKIKLLNYKNLIKIFFYKYKKKCKQELFELNKRNCKREELFILNLTILVTKIKSHVYFYIKKIKFVFWNLITGITKLINNVYENIIDYIVTAPWIFNLVVLTFHQYYRGVDYLKKTKLRWKRFKKKNFYHFFIFINDLKETEKNKARLAVFLNIKNFLKLKINNNYKNIIYFLLYSAISYFFFFVFKFFFISLYSIISLYVLLFSYLLNIYFLKPIILFKKYKLYTKTIYLKNNK